MEGGGIGAEEFAEGFAAGEFIQEQAAVGGGKIFEPDGLMQFREDGAAALLAGFEENALPTFHAFGGGFVEAFFRAFTDDGAEGGDAEFGGLFEHPFEVIELEDGGEEGERGEGRGLWQAFPDAEDDEAFAGGFHFGEVEVFVVADGEELAGFDAEDADKVLGEVAFEFGEVSPDLGHIEESSSHYNRGLTMIAHLTGTVLEKQPHVMTLDVQGVGYEVFIPVSTFTQLGEVGEPAKLRIHTSVREDAIQLYGFATAEEKTLFEKLISVSGIGAKLALAALSGMRPPDLAAAIRGSDIALLTRIPGVGKKTAERIVVELRDKIDALPGAAGKAAAVLAGPVAMLSEVERDVVSALTNLGSPQPVAEAAVAKAKAAGVAVEFEPLFRKSLELVR